MEELRRQPIMLSVLGLAAPMKRFSLLHIWKVISFTDASIRETEFDVLIDR
jgi:hypothetical protein